MTSVAAVDCGTNAIRLLLVEQDKDGCVHEVARRMEIVRLGEGVDKNGVFDADAIERTRQALSKYVDIMLTHNVECVRMVATSASRDADNRDDFFAMTQRELSRVIPGSQAEVISGEEEAQLSFGGAVADLHSSSGPFLVVDLGGGSTELALGGSETEQGTSSQNISSGLPHVDDAISLNIGCVRLTERYLHSQPPTEEEITAARQCVREQLDIAFNRLAVDTVHTWVGLAGTFTTIAALALHLDKYDAARIHHSCLSLAQLQRITDYLIRMTPEQRMDFGPMHPGRADVIGGGAIVVQELASQLNSVCGVTEVVVSERDILDGLVYGLLHRRA